MNLKQMYEFVVSNGIENDPRGKKEVEQILKETNEEYNALSDEKKKYFDKVFLTNPYHDSRIINETGNEDIKSIMVGIDIEVPELLLANQLKLSGKKIDLVLAHHPEAKAYATFSDVINMQGEIAQNQGVPINISEKLISERANEVGRSVAGSNHQRVYDVARFLQTKINELNPRYLKDIVKFLNEQPEYQYARTFGNGPFILNGSEKSKPGKIFVDMTGGTEGPVEMFEKLSSAGVGTIVGMHLSERGYKAAQKAKINVIIAGHISSDNLGMNLMLDAVEKKFGKLEFIECSGFRRFRR